MTLKKSILDQADKSLPALNYAIELQGLAADVGFDWPDVQGVIDKINEELAEVIAEIDKPDNQARLMDEFGDLLFACTNLARHLKLDPQQAINAGNKKFYRRFFQLERHINQAGKQLTDCSLEELDNHWEQVKLEIGDRENPGEK